jgi:hypothetical protein
MVHFKLSADGAGARKPPIRGRKEAACLEIGADQVNTVVLVQNMALDLHPLSFVEFATGAGRNRIG